MTPQREAPGRYVFRDSRGNARAIVRRMDGADRGSEWRVAFCGLGNACGTSDSYSFHSTRRDAFAHVDFVFPCNNGKKS